MNKKKQTGWLHEQSRPDRDTYITVLYENIQQGMENQFMKMPSHMVGQMNFPYDYKSLMHYPDNAFSKNGKPTIVAKQSGVVFGERDRISDNDLAELRSAYKCTA